MEVIDAVATLVWVLLWMYLAAVVRTQRKVLLHMEDEVCRLANKHLTVHVHVAGQGDVVGNGPLFSPPVPDQATREHMRAWAEGRETHRGEAGEDSGHGE